MTPPQSKTQALMVKLDYYIRAYSDLVRKVRRLEQQVRELTSK